MQELITGVANSSRTITLSDSGTYEAYDGGSGAYDYEDGVVSLKYNDIPIWKYNVKKLNGTIVLYTESFNYGEQFVYATNVSGLNHKSFDVETNLTSSKSSYVFKTDGTCTDTRTNDTGTWSTERNYSFYPDLNYILINEGWYKFTDETHIKDMTEG